MYFTQNTPSDGHSLHRESVTYKTTTTFIHEQCKHKSEFTKKKVCGLFSPPMGRITEEEQTDCRVILSVHAMQRYMSVGQATLV